MAHVRLDGVNVQIPVYDAHALRLLRLPAFGRAKVGTNTASYAAGVMYMHALKNLTLSFSEGDRVCVIGRNGAGKTTLLRLVAGIYPPTSGTVDISGSIFALLGNSVALNSDATGYENIRLFATLYDWPKESLADHIRDIEEFTELGEYLSLPTRVYSAGMQTRLAFALATTRAAEILLIDEGIEAGDAQFRDKAQARVRDFVSRAKVLLLASHSPELCRALCTKAVLMAKGEPLFAGGIDEAFARYADLT